MYVPVLQTLPFSVLTRRGEGRMSQLLDEKTFAFRFGRDALWRGLQYLNIKNGSTILVPCSLCEAVLEPLLAANVKLKYYSLDRMLNYNLSEICDKIDEQTCAVYIIHYFGFCQDVDDIRSLCDDKGIALIEDCAHAFGGRYNDRPLGDWGDISIFSLRKFLPIAEGGLLKINRVDNHFYPEPLKSRYVQVFKSTVKLMVKDLALKGYFPACFFNGSNCDLWSNGNGTKIKELIEKKYKFDYDLSGISRFVINRLNPEKIISARRENFLYWLNNISSIPGFMAAHKTLEEGICPYNFPVLVEDRDKLVAMLESDGIYLEPPVNYPCYNLPMVVNSDERFSDVEHLADHCVGLPVHQSMDKDALGKLKNKLVEVLCR